MLLSATTKPQQFFLGGHVEECFDLSPVSWHLVEAGVKQAEL